MLQPLNTHVVLTPAIKSVSLQLHNCNLAAVINGDVNIWCAGYLIGDPSGGCDPKVENHWLPGDWEYYLYIFKVIPKRFGALLILRFIQTVP